MVRYIARRLLFLIPTLLIIITVIFFIIRVAPGGPFDSEKKLPQVIQDNLDKKYHLNEPLGKQYLRYMGDILFRFDFGPSFSNRAFTVNELIAKRLPVSALIGGLAMLCALLFGITYGLLAAHTKNSLLDHLFTGISLSGISFPLFVIAPILVLLFARKLGWVPVAGWGRPANLLVPVLSLSLPYIAYIARLTKTGILEISSRDFIRTARAKGLSERTILLKHTLKGALIPVVSFTGPASAGILTGSMVIEQICNLPGLGKDFVTAAFNRDYTLIAGVMIVYAVILVGMNLLVDIIYGLLDPRITYN